MNVIIVRSAGRMRKGGEPLFTDRYGWFAALSKSFPHPLPLVTVNEDCGVRKTAIRLLASSSIEWYDAFLGGGIAGAVNAAGAGLGIAPLPVRLAASTLAEVGDLLGLPELPTEEMVLYARPVDDRTRETLRILASAFRRTSG